VPETKEKESSPVLSWFHYRQILSVICPPFGGLEKIKWIISWTTAATSERGTAVVCVCAWRPIRWQWLTKNTLESIKW
jgi:hypothetical protein